MVHFRTARKDDLPTILEMIANDQLGRSREQFELPLPQSYTAAFERIQKDENQQLMVVEFDGRLAGTFQLSWLQYLTYKGGLRLLVEAVRIKEDFRGHGLGTKTFQYIIDLARERGAHMVQLTSNKKRAEALKFYQSLGFEASHEGFKLHL